MLFIFDNENFIIQKFVILIFYKYLC